MAKLTPTELNYLSLLISADRPVTIDEFIACHKRSDEIYYGGNLVAVHIKNLRAKVADKYVITAERGVGYRLSKVETDV